MRINADILAVLDQAEIQGNTLRLCGQLDRKVYEHTNKVLEAAGGKWNRKAKAHVFEGEAIDAIEAILLTGEVAMRRDFDDFPSPPAIVHRLIELAEIEPGMEVLEPSAGAGAIAKAISDTHAIVDCVELQQRYANKLLDWFGVALVLHVGDFLALTPRPVYDRIVMNPPFRNQADIKHITHALKFLKPGGKLTSVMSAGITFRQNRLTNDFRALLDVGKAHIEKNPDNAFKESGTLVSTVNIVIGNC